LQAIEIVLKESISHTPDMGGKANTEQCGNALASVVEYILR